MVAKQWLLLGLLLPALAGVGCIRNCRSNPHMCLRPVEEMNAPAPARFKVYVFLMNGHDLFDLGQLKELECRINDAGFPKVYYAQRFDQEWYYQELHRLRRDDADNRFVLVGQGTAADQVQQLAGRVTADGIPLDAVVFLDPAGGKADLSEGDTYTTSVVRSRRWPAAWGMSTSRALKIPDVGHGQQPTHPATVDELVGILTYSALQVPVERKPVECIPLTDEPRPIPRPAEPKMVPPAPPGWDALCPNFGQK